MSNNGCTDYTKTFSFQSKSKLWKWLNWVSFWLTAVKMYALIWNAMPCDIFFRTIVWTKCTINVNLVNENDSVSAYTIFRFWWVLKKSINCYCLCLLTHKFQHFRLSKIENIRNRWNFNDFYVRDSNI